MHMFVTDARLPLTAISVRRQAASVAPPLAIEALKWLEDAAQLAKAVRLAVDHDHDLRAVVLAHPVTLVVLLFAGEPPRAAPHLRPQCTKTFNAGLGQLMTALVVQQQLWKLRVQAVCSG